MNAKSLSAISLCSWILQNPNLPVLWLLTIFDGFALAKSYRDLSFCLQQFFLKEKAFNLSNYLLLVNWSYVFIWFYKILKWVTSKTSRREEVIFMMFEIIKTFLGKPSVFKWDPESDDFKYFPRLKKHWRLYIEYWLFIWTYDSIAIKL